MGPVTATSTAQAHVDHRVSRPDEQGQRAGDWAVFVAPSGRVAGYHNRLILGLTPGYGAMAIPIALLGKSALAGVAVVSAGGRADGRSRLEPSVIRR